MTPDTCAAGTTGQGPKWTHRVLKGTLPACAFSLVWLLAGCGSGEEENPAGGATPPPVIAPSVALPPVPPDSAEKAGFLVYRDGVASQVFALNLSNGERIPAKAILPAAAATMVAFDCTRDGRQIAYANAATQGRVTVVSFAGEGARQEPVEVPGTIQSMAWSPQGDHIAINLFDDSGFKIAVLNATSGEVSNVSFGTGTPGIPRWSPDGQRLVLDINENGQSDIYLLDIASSNRTKISTRPSAFNPDWSPDGQTIVFSAADDQGGLPQLYLVAADGQNERKLTSSNTQKWAPRWSLDGSLVSYIGAVSIPAVSVRPVRLHTQAVWVAGADGTNEVAVTDITLDAVPLGWCLRGSWLQ